MSINRPLSLAPTDLATSIKSLKRNNTRFFATVDDLEHGADKQQLARQVFDHCTLLGLRVLVNALRLPVPLEEVIHALKDFRRVECLLEKDRGRKWSDAKVLP